MTTLVSLEAPFTKEKYKNALKIILDTAVKEDGDDIIVEYTNKLKKILNTKDEEDTDDDEDTDDEGTDDEDTDDEDTDDEKKIKKLLDGYMLMMKIKIK